MKILAFGGSTSSTSINRTLANYTANLIEDAEVTELDLNSYDLPIFSEDLEKADGIPTDAQKFLDAIREHDAIIVSLAEHNGSYSAAFKNLYDWTSRIEMKLWSDKPMLLMATSPGPGGAKFVLAAAESKFPRMGADLKASFSLPSFYDHFGEDGITNDELAAQHKQALSSLSEAL
ncbi:NAD(P)H-dependent FMN reductase [Rubritalea squalenifaciens DSM 18772]|uniref:NAD(P)H-dependent FMN reductase n=1 Tax=Rubritalea squalenifaciens DSM 18772 TaxID=1123071 RepID=A0A1M6SQ78_9BACT|nr:NADPH-dependent FMN reductase [Rubritalea squalenifaciens]SHK46891.1 NAD(P)H-dependent FMN reductase [Rubritalea squalenifaciens DSM 18772]